VARIDGAFSYGLSLMMSSRIATESGAKPSGQTIQSESGGIACRTRS